MKIRWSIDPMKRLDVMTRGMRNKVTRPAVKAAAVEMTADVKSAAPKDQGALKASIGNKVYVGKKQGIVLGVVGAKSSTGSKKKRKAFKRFVKHRGAIVLRGRGARAGEAYVQMPSKYLFLVERGHRFPRKRGGFARAIQSVKRFFGGGGRVKAHPFMEKTLSRGWPKYESTMRNIVSENLKAMMP